MAVWLSCNPCSPFSFLSSDQGCSHGHRLLCNQRSSHSHHLLCRPPSVAADRNPTLPSPSTSQHLAGDDDAQWLPPADHYRDLHFRHSSAACLPSFNTLSNLVQQCRTLTECQRIHTHISACGFDRIACIGNQLVQMYARFEALDHAQAVFDKISFRDLYSWNVLLTAHIQNDMHDKASIVFRQMPHPNVVSWNAMIAAYTRKGDISGALDLYHEMQTETIVPNKVTYICAVEACASMGDILKGQKIHVTIVDTGFELDIVVATALINMYANGSYLNEAVLLFHRMPHRNVVTWTSMISACVENAYHQEALQLFAVMELDKIVPNEITYMHALCACSGLAALQLGYDIHFAMLIGGFDQDTILGSTLIKMYSACGALGSANYVFAKLNHKDVICWNTMIAAFVEMGCHNEALVLFYKMLVKSVMPNNVSYLYALEACGSLGGLNEAYRIYCLMVENTCEQEFRLGTASILTFGNCGSVHDAKCVFQDILWQDPVSWNVMIKVFAENGCVKEGLELFNQMLCSNFELDKGTFISALELCNTLETLESGWKMHAHIVECAYEEDIMVSNMLLNMYGKCRNVDDAKRLFDRMGERDVVSWNTFISGQLDHNQESLDLYNQMQCDGIMPNKVSFLVLLDACSNLASGLILHDDIVQRGYDQDAMIGNALIVMYGKCEAVVEAKIVFDSMLQQNLVSWTSMIAAYSQNKQGDAALSLFHRMQHENISLDNVAFICVLDACTNTVALKDGRELHAYITVRGREQELTIATALLFMYGKCGSIVDAISVFENLHEHDIMCWNAILTACAQNGYASKVFEYFQQMQREGVSPNSITFTSLLTACSHTGRVHDGKRYFLSMLNDYGIPHTVEHYVCMIDLLGRAGLLDDAQKLATEMQFEGNPAAWASMVNSCKIHGDVDRAINAEDSCSLLM